MQYLVTFYIKDLSKYKEKFGIIPLLGIVLPVHSLDELLKVISDFFETTKECYCASYMEEMDSEKAGISFSKCKFVENPFYKVQTQIEKFDIKAEKYLQEIVSE